MYPEVDANELNIFQEPARLVFAGYSGSGKSWLVSKLLNKYKHAFSKIIVVGSNLENISGVEITRMDDFDPYHEPISSDVLVIYDDVLLDKGKHLYNAAQLFIKGRHGMFEESRGAYSTIFLTQNIFHADKHYRSLVLNATGIFLLKQRDFRQIRLFASTFLEKEAVGKFLKMYKQVMTKKYGYIYVDYNKPPEDVLALRSNVAGEGYEIAYKL